MLASAPDDRPFVETSIARQLLSRLTVTHEERGISVIAGPWGIGKTTALDAFVASHELSSVIVKVDPGAKKGASAISVMQQSVEALRPLAGFGGQAALSHSYAGLKRTLHSTFIEWQRSNWSDDDASRTQFTFIFDEAQYLSRQAIEMLRYWNDGDRATTPFPVGLAFIGNHEFALQEDATGQSVLSGAVRSRAIFIESLEYADVSNADLALFFRSRGIADDDAIRAFIDYFSRPRIGRDLRNVERFVGIVKRRAGAQTVTADIVRSILAP